MGHQIGWIHLQYKKHMKKHFLVLSCLLFCANNLWAQLNDSVLIDCYGAIRAEMVRTVCQFVGFNDSAVIQKISNESLEPFKDSLANLKSDTLLRIINRVQGINGSAISKYDEDLKFMRREVRDVLIQFYPEKEYEIENVFLEYIKQIEDLTKECNAFNVDTTLTKEQYAKEYPSGRFSKFVESLRNADSSNNKKNRDSQSGEVNSVEDSNEKNMEQGILCLTKAFLITLLKWCIGLILTSFLLLIAIKKKRKIVLSIKKMYSKIMHKDDIVDAEELQDKDRVDSDSQLATGKPVVEIVAEEREEKRTDEIQNAGNGSQGAVQETPPNPQPKKKTQIDPKGKSIALDADEWVIVGASVQGNGHISMDLPCQDSHAYEYIRDGWGIAITSDGAGSAKLSHIGSAASVERARFHFKDLIEKERWIEMGVLPSDIEWMKKSYQVLKTVRNELEQLAKNIKCDIKDLSATIIVVIHTPIGLLSVHIGDGRAGYKDMHGEWHSLITPHKGEEANQTIFIPSDFWNIQFYEMSGVTVPESKIVREKVAAFTLMSDGCEGTSWLWNQFNESTGKYYDPNMPHRIFFDSLLDTLHSFRKKNVPLDERKEKWYNFIKEGNKSFMKETDDKTMILGALYK